MVKLRDAWRPAAVGIGLLCLTACATASSPDQMSVSAGATAQAAPGSRSDHSFRLGAVNGGAQTEAIGLSEVSNDALHAALESSLHNLNYLADDPSKAAYVVSADLVDLDRPVAAFDPALLFVPIDLTVTVKIHYTVTRTTGGAPVFDEVVATTGTGGAGDALTPVGRVRKGVEDGVRLNIAAFVRRLQTEWK